MSSIYDLMKRVREHPDFVFGTIFTRDDFDGNEAQGEAIAAAPKHAEEALVAAGNTYIENAEIC
jgi:hypothetical protein